MFDQALVVESRFGSRRKLVSDLYDCGLIGDVVEAKSVFGGIQELETRAFLTCIIGPTLTEPIAVDFLRRGKAVSRSKECAFVAVIDKDSKSAEALLQAGADGALEYPYLPRTFGTIVKEAVEVARERYLRVEEAQQEVTLQTLALGQKGLAHVYGHQAPSLAEVLSTAASGFRSLGREISLGRLKLKKDGSPSLAVRDALRIVLENALYADSELKEFVYGDQVFILALIQWFEDRVSLPHDAAVERLRKTLLAGMK